MKKTILLLVSINSLQAHNKIIYVISPPRNFSTLFMRSFEGRTDTAVYNEPTMAPFIKIEKPGWHVDFKENSFNTYQEMCNSFYSTAKKAHVLVKDISFICTPFIRKTPDFVKCSDVHFVFLLRNPHHALISLAKQLNKTKYEWISEFYKDTYHLFTHINRHAKNPPVIILAESFYAYPEKTLSALCKHLKIDYQPNMLVFKDLGDNFDGSLWHEQKINNLLYKWHADAIRSTKIKKPRQYTVDAQGNPTFIEIEKHKRPLYKQAYKTSAPFYKKLLKKRNYLLKL